MIEEFDEEKAEPKINEQKFIENLEIKIDFIFNFIEKYAKVAEKEKEQTDIWGIATETYLSKELLNFLAEEEFSENIIFIILDKIQYLMSSNILLNDGYNKDAKDAEEHGLVSVYVKILIKLSKIRNSKIYIDDFLEYITQGGRYNTEMHKSWSVIKKAFLNHKIVTKDTKEFIEIVEKCIDENLINRPSYLLRINGPKMEEIKNFIQELNTRAKR
jgi:hypothetical protein